MSRSNSDTEPASGESSPVIRLNRVVLPAPLGPMISRRSPGSTERLTPAVTRRPPNDLSRSFTASAVIVAGDYPTGLTGPGPRANHAPIPSHFVDVAQSSRGPRHGPLKAGHYRTCRN